MALWLEPANQTLPRKNLQMERECLADSHNDVLVFSFAILFTQPFMAGFSNDRCNNLGNIINF